MISKTLTKVKIVFLQNIHALFIVLFWFGAHFLYFYWITGEIFESLKIIFFFKEGPGEYGFFYANFTEFIIFGLVFSLITIELFRKYNPEVTCREICQKLDNHVVIIGYSAIGRGLAEYLSEKGISHVIIERNLKLIEHLIENEEPVINDNAEHKQTLIDARVDKARAVFVLSDNIEVQLVSNSLIREMNPDCLIVGRIFQDDIGKIISKTYDSHMISTSKFAANLIFEKIIENDYKYVLILSMNHISERLVKQFKKLDVNFKIIEEDEELIEHSMIELTDPCVILGDPKELSILELAHITEVDCVVNLTNDISDSIIIAKRIRDLNPNCKIICRIFIDTVAEMLEKPPFNCDIVSSSKATISELEKKGLLDF